MSPSSRRLVVVLLAAAVALGCLWLALPRLVEAWLVAALRAEGVASAQLRVTELHLTGAVLEGIEIGARPDLSVTSVRLAWRPRALLAGNIDAVHAQGVSLRGVWASGARPHFGEADALLEGRGNAMPSSVELSDIEVSLALPSGSVALTGFVAGASDGVSPNALRFDLEAAGAALSGHIEGRWSAGGSSRLRAQLSAAQSPDPRVGSFAGAALTLDATSEASPAAFSEIADPHRWLALFAGRADARLSLREWRPEPGAPAQAAEASLRVRAARGEPVAVEVESALSGGANDVKLELGFALARDPHDLWPALVRSRLEAARSARRPAISVAGVFRLGLGAGSLTVAAAEPLLLHVASGALGGGYVLAAPLSGTLARLSFALDRSTRAIRASADLQPMQLALALEGASFAAGQTPQLALELVGPVAAPALRLVARGGDLVFPGAQTRVTAVALDTVFPTLSPLAWGPVVIAGVHLEDTAPSPSYAPLDARGEASGIAQVLALRGSFRERTSARWIPFTLRERHRPAQRFSQFEVAVGPIRFDAERRTPAQLAPRLTGVLDSLEGEFTWRGRLQLPEGGAARWSGRFASSGLSVRHGDLQISALSGELEVPSLAPLLIRPSPLKFAHASAGPGLTVGGARLEIDAGALHLAKLEASALGGRIAGDLQFDLTSERGELTLQLAGVSVEALARWLDVEGLRADGALSGEIGAELVGASFELRSGKLSADGPGAIRYRPERPPPALTAVRERSSVLLAALTDFRFERLAATLTPAPSVGATVLDLSLDGRNPTLQAGRPIELRARIEAPLREIFRLSDVWEQWLHALSRRSPPPRPAR